MKQINPVANSVGNSVGNSVANSVGNRNPTGRVTQGARMNQSSEGSRLLPRGHPLGASIFGGGFDDVVPTRGLEPKSTIVPRPSNEVYQKSSAFEIE